MIEFRLKTFSNSALITRNLFGKLAQDKISDEFYEEDTYPSDEFVSIETNLNDLKIYFPEEFEYDRYDVEDELRKIVPMINTSVEQDGHLFVMTLDRTINEIQYQKLVKFLIKHFGFCIILNR